MNDEAQLVIAIGIMVCLICFGVGSCQRMINNPVPIVSENIK